MSQAKNLWKGTGVLFSFGVLVLFWGFSEHGQTEKLMVVIGLLMIVLGCAGMIAASRLAKMARDEQAELRGNSGESGGVSIEGRGLELNGSNVTVHGENVSDEEAQEIIEDIFGNQGKN